MLLVGDIGGTKTDLAVYSSEGALRRPLAETTYASAQYPGLEELVCAFLEGLDCQVDRASFGDAPPLRTCPGCSTRPGCRRGWASHRCACSTT
jgi:glucokinase